MLAPTPELILQFIGVFVSAVSTAVITGLAMIKLFFKNTLNNYFSSDECKNKVIMLMREECNRRHTEDKNSWKESLKEVVNSVNKLEQTVLQVSRDILDIYKKHC